MLNQSRQAFYFTPSTPFKAMPLETRTANIAQSRVTADAIASNRPDQLCLDWLLEKIAKFSKSLQINRFPSFFRT
jgi:hypothetical protein